MTRDAVEIVALEAGDAGGEAGDVTEGDELLLVELHVVVVVAEVIAAVAEEVEVVAELLGLEELNVALVDLEGRVDALVFAVEQDGGVHGVAGGRAGGGGGGR
ncbi:hypothetical protein GP486_008949 [Trichoglossum hirsutum]|uniref:Uncharacterized protein n=1 Tax=Trichoglossum hirsutum TaxID=265104 RepID=A0A9P8KWE5_9PEZI|nr:hypothetical protein GP486_008949 [Trichoglossum hirsutum]